MTGEHNPLLWQNEAFIIRTPLNPHIPYSEGLHIIVAPKLEFANAWQNIDIATQAFNLATKACKIMEDIQLAPWFNIQANGNWGLLEGATPFFHVHIYGRNKGETWGKPLVLPVAPKTYKNDPMPDTDIAALRDAFAEYL